MTPHMDKVQISPQSSCLESMDYFSTNIFVGFVTNIRYVPGNPIPLTRPTVFLCLYFTLPRVTLSLCNSAQEFRLSEL